MGYRGFRDAVVKPLSYLIPQTSRPARGFMCFQIYLPTDGAEKTRLFLSAAFCQFGSSSSETHLCWSHVALCLVQIVQISQSHQKTYKHDAKLSPVCHFGSYRFAQPVILLYKGPLEGHSSPYIFQQHQNLAIKSIILYPYSCSLT